MQLELNKSSWSQPDKPYWEMPEAQPVEERVSLDKMQDLSWLKTNEELLQLNESDEFKDLSWLKTEEELNRLDGNVFTDIKNRELQHGYFTNSGLIWGQVLLGVKSQDEAYKEQKQVDYKYRGIEDIQLPNWRENPIRSAVTSGYGIARYVVDSAAFATAVAGGTRLAGKTAAKGAAALAGKTALKAVPYVGWGIAGFEAVSAISKAPTFALSTIARIGFLEGGMIMKNMLDNGVSVPVARALSISAGAVIGAIEVFFMKPFAMFGEAASNMFRKTITSGAAKATLRAVTQKMLADASMKGLLIEAAKNVGWNTAEELVQQLTEETANLIASKLEDKPELIKSPEEFREMMLDTLVETASGMGVVGLFGISAKHLSAKAQIGRMKLTLALQKRADGEELSPSEQKLVSEHDAENKKRKDEIFERERKAEQMLIDEDKAAEKEISEETKKEQEEAEVKLQEELQQEIDIAVEKEAVDQDVSEVIESVEEYDDRKANALIKNVESKKVKDVIAETTGVKQETKTVKIMKNMAEMYKAQIKAVGYTLKNAKAVAKKMVQQLKESGLDPKNQAKFMTFITNNLKPETFEKNQDVFFEKIARSLEQQEIKKAKEARKARHKELKVVRKKMLSLARVNGGKITAIAKDNVNNLLSGMDKEDINDMSLLQLKLEEAAKMIEEGKKDFAEKVRQRRKEVKMFYLAAEEAKEKGIKLGIKSAQFGKLQSAFGEGGAFNRAIAFLRNAFIKLQFKKHDIYFTDYLLDEIDGKQGYKGFVYKTFGIDVNQSYDNFDKAEIAYMDRVQKIMRDNKITEQDLFAVMIYSIAQQKDGIDIILTQNFKEFQTEQDVVNFRLSDKQSEVYNEMQNIYEEIYPQLREVMQDVYNENIGWIEKYSPFLLDWASMSDLTIDDMAVGFGAGKSEGARSTIFNPFAKTRFGKEGLLNRNAYDVFTKYVRDTTYLIHMAKAIQRNANIVNSEGFSDVVGDIGQDILRRNTELLANKGRADAIIPFLDTLRKNVSNATLAFKITSALVQWTSILHAASLIDSYAFMGLAHAFSVEDLDFVIKNMPEVARRVGDDPAVLDTQLNKLTRTGSSAMVFIDKRMAVATAWGAYAKWCDENGVVFDKNNPHADGLTYAQDIVAKTQASQRITRLPMILKSGDFLGLEGKPIGTSLSKAIFQFQSFVINEWGLFAHDIMGYGFKDPKRTATGLLWLNVAKIAETALRMGGWMLEDAITGDDKDRDFFWELIENYIQGMPVVAQIYGGIAYGEVPIPAISMLQKALKKAKQEKNVAAAVLLLGALKGVPGAGLFHRIDRGSKKKQRITY